MFSKNDLNIVINKANGYLRYPYYSIGWFKEPLIDIKEGIEMGYNWLINDFEKTFNDKRVKYYLSRFSKDNQECYSKHFGRTKQFPDSMGEEKEIFFKYHEDKDIFTIEYVPKNEPIKKREKNQNNEEDTKKLSFIVSHISAEDRLIFKKEIDPEGLLNTAEKLDKFNELCRQRAMSLLKSNPNQLYKNFLQNTAKDWAGMSVTLPYDIAYSIIKKLELSAKNYKEYEALLYNTHGFEIAPYTKSRATLFTYLLSITKSSLETLSFIRATIGNAVDEGVAMECYKEIKKEVENNILLSRLAGEAEGHSCKYNPAKNCLEVLRQNTILQ